MANGKEMKGLLETDSIFLNLVERIPAVVYIDLADDSGKTVFISSFIYQLLGYSPKDWMDKPDLCKDLIHPHDRERVAMETQATIDS